jgi:hypothetical protein
MFMIIWLNDPLMFFSSVSNVDFAATIKPVIYCRPVMSAERAFKRLEAWAKLSISEAKSSQFEESAWRMRTLSSAQEWTFEVLVHRIIRMVGWFAIFLRQWVMFRFYLFVISFSKKAPLKLTTPSPPSANHTHPKILCSTQPSICFIFFESSKRGNRYVAMVTGSNWYALKNYVLS